MDEPHWLTRAVVDGIHADQLRQHGGLSGLRDEGVLEAALARPKHLQRYADNPNVTRLAAAYGVGLARNHPYQDGNKRTAFMAMYVFLRRTGYRIEAPETAVVDLMRAVARGDCGQEELAAWLDEHTTPDSSSLKTAQ